MKAMLSVLPPELLLVICDFLLPVPVDLNCFSLCNHRHYELYRAYYNRLPALAGREKSLLLMRIERDLPKYFACYICNKLHWYDAGRYDSSYGLGGLAHRKTSTLPCDYKGHELWSELYGFSPATFRTHNSYSHSESRLSHLQVKLAMRRFHYGANFGISTDTLSYTQIRSYACPIQPTSTTSTQPSMLSQRQWLFVPTLFSREALICPEQPGLCIRTQDILLYKTWEDSKIEYNINPLKYYEFCRHGVVLRYREYIDQLREGKRPELFGRCAHCTVKWQVEIFECKGMVDSEYPIALIITRWFNLGAGLDYQDPLWLIHCQDPTGARPERIENLQDLKDSRRCFEDKASVSWQKLRKSNLYRLGQKRYKLGAPYKKDSPYLWYIPYDEPSKLWRVFKKYAWKPIWSRLWPLAKSPETKTSAQTWTERTAAAVRLANREGHKYYYYGTE